MKTMKKLAYLLGLVMVLTIGFSSCQKDDGDDPIVPVVLNQPTAYFGTWNAEIGGGVLVIGKNTITNTVGSIVNTNVVNWSVDKAETTFTKYKDVKGTVVYATNTITETPTNVSGQIEMELDGIVWIKQ